MDGKNAYIFPSLLNQALTKAGYSPRKTMRYLGDNGLIAASPKKSGGKEYTKPKWFDNRTVRFVEFHLWMLAKEKDPLLDEDEIAEDISGKNGFRQVSMGCLLYTSYLVVSSSNGTFSRFFRIESSFFRYLSMSNSLITLLTPILPLRLIIFIRRNEKT